jgi:hypothetical protein
MERRRPISPPPDDVTGRAPTRLQTKTVCVAPDEVETVHDQTSNHAALDDIQAYLKAMGEAGDEGTCMGDMVAPGAKVLAAPPLASKMLPAPKVLPAPILPSSIVPAITASMVHEPKTVHAYCEPMLPFLPVEDLAAPMEEEVDLEDLYEPRLEPSDDDPIQEYLREVTDDFEAAIVVPVRTPPPHIAPQPLGEMTMLEQVNVKTACVRYKPPVNSGNFSARMPAVKKRRTPLWAAALMGALISVLLLTSSVFTVEVLASKRTKTPPAAPKPVETQDPQPWVVPR